ncbi:MAG: PqiC family protein, partial [Pseudomonadota bacterium]|nr:PqiC family protein [Pseudomonadota bacterium]
MNIFHPDTPRPWLGVAWTALTVSALAVGGCAGSPSTRYYVVTPVAARAPSNTAYAGPAIEVRVVQVPPALDRLEMVRDSDPGRVEVLDFDHWAAPLGRLARQTLTEDLARRLPPDKVVIPGAAWPGPRASLTVDILSYA